MTVEDLPMPEGLTAFAQRSWANAVAALEGADGRALREPLERYVRACDMVGRMREEWERDGCPATAQGGATGKALVAHPLIRLIEDGEKAAAKLYEDLLPARGSARRGGGTGGRPVGAQSAPDRRSRPAPPAIRQHRARGEGGGELRAAAG